MKCLCLLFKKNDTGHSFPFKQNEFEFWAPWRNSRSNPSLCVINWKLKSFRGEKLPLVHESFYIGQEFTSISVTAKMLLSSVLFFFFKFTPAHLFWLNVLSPNKFQSICFITRRHGQFHSVFYKGGFVFCVLQNYPSF